MIFLKRIAEYTKIIRVILIIGIIFGIWQSNTFVAKSFTRSPKVDSELESHIKQIVEARNRVLLSGEMEQLETIYDMNTKFGVWAYEHEIKKMKYIHNWEQKQGVKFIEINPKVVVRWTKKNEGKINATTTAAANFICSTEYKYVYTNKPDIINTSRIGTYHYLSLVLRDNIWVISKEWYKDPFADSLKINTSKAGEIKEFINNQEKGDFSKLNQRRVSAIEYADKYCGAASDGRNGFSYNKKYLDYNSKGGDCANFSSQILFEGGKFRKTSSWNYNGGGATRAWVNADGFKSHMINSGKASVIAYGEYKKVFKASYKLLPGDFVAYEKKGDIVHISMVTDADSRGYSLVSCHNTDRNRVPWDLGWSDNSIRYWLVRVHY
jgi:hypothetical protein